MEHRCSTAVFAAGVGACCFGWRRTMVHGGLWKLQAFMNDRAPHLPPQGQGRPRVRYHSGAQPIEVRK